MRKLILPGLFFALAFAFCANAVYADESEGAWFTINGQDEWAWASDYASCEDAAFLPMAGGTAPLWATLFCRLRCQQICAPALCKKSSIKGESPRYTCHIECLL